MYSVTNTIRWPGGVSGLLLGARIKCCLAGNCGRLNRKERWTPSEGDRLKVNEDGAFNLSTRQGGWGFVVHGQVRGRGASRLSHFTSPAQAEAGASADGIYSSVQSK